MNVAEADEGRADLAESVVVLARVGRDAPLVVEALAAAGMSARHVRDVRELLELVRTGVGLVVLTGESLTRTETAELGAVLCEQPPWSELPVLLLLAAEHPWRSARTPAPVLLSLPGVVVQQRPIAKIALVSAVQAAMQTRRQQYRVRDLLAREREARDAAEAASRVKEEFLTAISHELRAPLGAILIWANLLRGGTLTPEQVGHGVDVILMSADAQQRLIEDLLDVGRMLSGKLRIETKPQSLVPIIERAVDTLQPAAAAKGMRIDVNIEPGIEPVPVDGERMQQVLWNLLSNAVKFTPQNGRVSVALEREPEHARIIVRDTGHGIAASVLPHVFERFRQEDATMTRRHGGLGLGLAIVRQLVELHGGDVQVASPGKEMGATFTVRLPLAGRPQLA